jgi:hypothetical protein
MQSKIPKLSDEFTAGINAVARLWAIRARALGASVSFVESVRVRRFLSTSPNRCRLSLEQKKS